MKHRMKFIIPLAIIVLGIIFMVTGFYMGAADDYKKSLNITNMESVISASGVKNLDINVQAAEFFVKASNEVNDFTLVAENISKNNLDYSVNNGTFKFRYEVKKWYNYADMIGLMKGKGKITLLVPANADLMDVQIVTGLSRAEISYLTAERIYIEYGYGGANIKNLSADHIEVGGKHGKAECCNLNCKTSNINCKSGKLSIGNINVENIGLTCGSGDIQLNGVIGGDSIVSCGSGDLLMNIYGDLHDFKFETQGKGISIDGKKEIPDNDKGSKKINASCGMGEVKIYFK